MLQQSYESLRSSTLRTLDVKLRRVGLILDRADQDAAYNFAWHGLYQRMLAGEEIDNLGGFLAQAAYFRAIDEARRLRLDRRADDCEVADLAAAAADLDQQLDDAQMLRSFAEGLRVRLRPREREAATLCYLHGYSRAEAADVLGLTPRRMGKVMDRVSKEVGSLVDDLREGDWCREQRSLITAYAFDALDRDGERHAIATSHLADCSACRALVRRLRAASAVVPPLALPWAVVGGVPTAAPEAVGEHLGSLFVPDRWSSRWTGVAANVAGAAPSLAALAPVVALAGAVGVSAAVRPATPPRPALVAAAQQGAAAAAPRIASGPPAALAPERARRSVAVRVPPARPPVAVEDALPVPLAAAPPSAPGPPAAPIDGPPAVPLTLAATVDAPQDPPGPSGPAAPAPAAPAAPAPTVSPVPAPAATPAPAPTPVALAPEPARTATADDAPAPPVGTTARPSSLGTTAVARPTRREPEPQTPNPDTPTPDPPKPDTPTPDPPKPDTPKPDPPKPDTPKPDTPKPPAPAGSPSRWWCHVGKWHGYCVVVRRPGQ